MPTIQVKKLKFINSNEHKNLYHASKKFGEYKLTYEINYNTAATQLTVFYGEDSDSQLMMTCLVNSYDDAVDAAHDHLKSYVKENVIVKIV